MNISTMNKVSLLDKFSSKETLSTLQAARLKGGDDKRPPLGLPNPGPRPNGNQTALGNNNQQ